jgi:hypothetical protein
MQRIASTFVIFVDAAWLTAGETQRCASRDTGKGSEEREPVGEPRTSEPNIIELDDPGSPRQRVFGAIVLMLIVATLALPVDRLVSADPESATPTTVTTGHQDIFEMCGRWNVPDYLQPLANVAYPSWNWVCRLVQP